MVKRDEGWTEIGGGRLPSNDQTVEFKVAGPTDKVLRGTFQKEKRPFTDGIKWVFISHDGGKAKSYRHGVTRWRPVQAEARPGR
jgi:hypothetical protein